MENSLEDLQDRITQNAILNTVLTAAPQLVEMYPKIISGIEMLSDGIDNFLGDDKMVVITRKNGKTRAVILNTKVEFNLSNQMKIEAKENAVLNNYEKNEWKEKLLESGVMQTIKEKHERLSTQNTNTHTED